MTSELDLIDVVIVKGLVCTKKCIKNQSPYHICYNLVNIMD